MNRPSPTSTSTNRWVIAIAAIFMQLALGSVYAWSVFLNPVIAAYHVTRLQANLTFSIVLLALGVTAGFGGYLNYRFGPRVIATAGGILYGIGVLLAAFVRPNLFLLYLTNPDRKSTRLNSSHTVISYAVFCLKKKTKPPHLLDTTTHHLLA